MRIPRSLVALILCLWLPLLALPMGRTNFLLQAFTPGEQFYVPDDSGEAEPAVEADPGLVLPFCNPAALAQSSPNDEKLQLGVAAGSGTSAPQLLEALATHYPRDPGPLAAFLTQSSNVLDYSEPGTGIDRPLTPDRTRDSLHILALARRGAALEPGNSYFDWVEMTALFALNRDPEALALVGPAAAKSSFDDHVMERVQALEYAYGMAGPLTPAEQEQVAAFQFESNHWTWSADADEVGKEVVRLRSVGQSRAAIALAVNMLQLEHEMGWNSYSLQGSWLANEMEDSTIRRVSGGNGAMMYFPTSVPRILSDPANLAGYMNSLGQKTLAKSIAGDWLSIYTYPRRANTLAFAAPGDTIASEASLQERWGRLLLHTLPLPLALLVLLLAANRKWPPRDNALAFSRWRGAVTGIVILLIFLAGDAAVASREDGIGRGPLSFHYFAVAMGLYALVPLLVTGGVGATFVILSLTGAWRRSVRGPDQEPWAKQIQSAFSHPGGLFHLNPTPLVRLTALATLWIPVAAVYLYICHDPAVSPGSGVGFEVFDFLDLLIFTAWLACLVRAGVLIFRVPDKRAGFALALLNLRQLAAGYILLVLVVYPLLAWPILVIERPFTAIYGAYLKAGETASVRTTLGLTP